MVDVNIFLHFKNGLPTEKNTLIKEFIRPKIFQYLTSG